MATTRTTYFQIEQSAHHGAVWEPVENSRSNTLADAMAEMSTLESQLGWRDLRVVEREETEISVRTISVREYGRVSETDDE